MTRVRFRFYGPLNDFLPLRWRQRRFVSAVAASASVKDAIEACGVPHPEVELILVNGRLEDFTCRLCDGDDVAVFPAFRSLDVSSLPRLGGAPPQPIRFVLDVHLGKLASLLRLCGFDAIVLADDADIASVAARDGRVALSRDVGLLKRGLVRHGYWVRHIHPERQLAEVVDRYGLAGRMEPFSRCLRCNTLLVPVDAASIAEQLPARTRASFQHYQRCPGCGRIYWAGSHYGRLSAIAERARRGR